MSNVIIRVFSPQDRDMVRQICCNTADQGNPIEGFFPDREIAADLLTKYYTDYEPASTFVAQKDGKVVGYILGCLDNRRYGLVLFWILIPQILIKGFFRGILFRPESWRVLEAMGRNWRRLLCWRKQSFHSHQGHLHIGVALGFQGQQTGQKLVAALLDYAHSQGIGEIAASVHDGNFPACRFFTYMGFEVQNRYAMTGYSRGTFEVYHSLMYVKKII